MVILLYIPKHGFWYLMHLPQCAPARRRPKQRYARATDAGDPDLKKMSTKKKLMCFLFHGERMAALLEVPEYQFSIVNFFYCVRYFFF
jgi:hypothetical protein